jgi:hypothetical protein
LNKLAMAPPQIDQSKQPKLSAADYKVLARLQRGCAYQVRGAWRIRGSRDCVKEPALLVLLEKGFAERGNTGPHAQVRITEAGRATNRVSRLAATTSQLNSAKPPIYKKYGTSGNGLADRSCTWPRREPPAPRVRRPTAGPFAISNASSPGDRVQSDPSSAKTAATLCRSTERDA